MEVTRQQYQDEVKAYWKGRYDKLQAELDQPITEHPDVQRLIGQVVELQAENAKLSKENKILKMLLYSSE